MRVPYRWTNPEGYEYNGSVPTVTTKHNKREPHAKNLTTSSEIRRLTVRSRKISKAQYSICSERWQASLQIMVILTANHLG